MAIPVYGSGYKTDKTISIQEIDEDFFEEM